MNQDTLNGKISDSISFYQKRLQETRNEKNRSKEVSRQGKLVVLQIAKNVQSMYLRLRCREVNDRTNMSSFSNRRSPIKLEDDRRLTMFTGEQVSERNILDHMEQIEHRSIQIIAEYAKTLAAGTRRGRRRPSVLVLVSHIECTSYLCSCHCL